MMKEKLDEIEKKLVELALKCEHANTIAKAVEALHTARELRKKKQEHSWTTAISALTPLFAMLITAITLGIQTSEANQKAIFEHNQAEEAEWRDVLKNVSLEDRNSVQMGLFGLQGFFGSKSSHAGKARSIATALLPLTSNQDGFDIIFSELQKDTSNSSQRDLLGIGRVVVAHDRDVLTKTMKQLSNAPPNCAKTYPEVFFTEEDCFKDNDSVDDKTLNDIWLYSWEIGSVSDGLVKLWNRPDGDAKPKGQNLSGVILEDANLSNLDFSGSDLSGAIIQGSQLAGAHFDGAVLDNSTFHSVKDFANSSWDHSKWWRAASLPCDLEDYLSAKPGLWDKQDRDAEAKIASLKASCTRT